MKNAPAPTSIVHLQHLSTLLQQELDYERENYRHSLSPERLSGRMHEAGCHYPIVIGQQDYNALNQLILTITFDINEEVIDNDFEPGKAVDFFYIAPDGLSTTRVPQSHFVDQVGDGMMRIRLTDHAAAARLRSLAANHLLGIQIGIDTTSYQVMSEALHQAIRSDNEHFVHLRETLIGTAEPAFRNIAEPSLPWLNPSQNHAVGMALAAREVAIVHGPPGTGKTTTLLEAIIETLAREPQVLVCAPSNAAVDWISEQLIHRGVPLLRIGNPLRISNEVLASSYERRYADHPDYIELWSIRKALRNPASIQGNGHERQARLKRMHERQVELEIKINNDLFDHARVVASTLIGSAFHIMGRRHFPTLFIDEAAQALEPACWAAILRADRVILGGDHWQLPPTVKDPDAARNGLGQTLMQHIVSSKPRCVTMLNMQYRMNQAIMDFPSRWFYHRQLVAAPIAAEQLVSPLDTPLTWIDTSLLDFTEQQHTHNASRSNASEARIVIQTLHQYVDMIAIERLIDNGTTFGIISPYRNQVRLLRRMIRSQRWLAPLRKFISVHTIDGFQGQERDVIIISMVRDNDRHAIGFLADLRRMNVAITRARMKLIIIANAQTLSHHPFYAQLIEHFQEHGSYIQLQPDQSADRQ
ncbi:MAG: AAA family ATPase [Bacteroidales bacterium]|nr:AAA family ATPase [Bacteroidales bacterium]